MKPKSPEKAPFRKARGIDIDNESQPSSSQAEVPSSGGPSFRRARGFQESSGHDSTEASTLSKIDESPFGRTSRSPSLSSLTSIGSPDVEEVELPKPSDHVAKSPCPLCKEQVEDSFKLDFEIEHCRGKRMNFRMQERFCKAHKTRAASQVWKDRNYPEIDWSSFHKRMKSHHSHLHAVLDGEVKSYYREQLEERLKSGSTKTAMKGINLDANTGSGVGYYGGRGERLMYVLLKRLEAFASNKFTGSITLCGHSRTRYGGSPSRANSWRPWVYRVACRDTCRQCSFRKWRRRSSWRI